MDQDPMSARDEVLTRGLIDWVPLQRVHYHMTREHPEEPARMTQQRVLDLIRALADDGLVELGDLNNPGDNFARWESPLEESVEHIRKVYVDRYDEDNVWPWYVWLNLTAKGEEVAQGIESAHAD